MSIDPTGEALLAHGLSRALVNESLKPVRLGVSGHQHLPPDSVAAIRASIRGVIRAAGPNALGVTSLAEGADQLFAAEVLAEDGALHVVLPSHKYEEAFASPAAAQDFRRLLGQARTVEILNFDAPSEAAYLAAGLRVVCLCDHLVAVWDGLPAHGSGGTADVVEYARRLGRPVSIVWPQGAVR